MVVSLAFLLVALGVEVCRATMPVFKADARKWRRCERTAVVDDGDGDGEDGEEGGGVSSEDDVRSAERYRVGVGAGEKA